MGLGGGAGAGAGAGVASGGGGSTALAKGGVVPEGSHSDIDHILRQVAHSWAQNHKEQHAHDDVFRQVISEFGQHFDTGGWVRSKGMAAGKGKDMSKARDMSHVHAGGASIPKIGGGGSKGIVHAPLPKAGSSKAHAPKHAKTGGGPDQIPSLVANEEGDFSPVMKSGDGTYNVGGDPNTELVRTGKHKLGIADTTEENLGMENPGGGLQQPAQGVPSQVNNLPTTGTPSTPPPPVQGAQSAPSPVPAGIPQQQSATPTTAPPTAPVQQPAPIVDAALQMPSDGGVDMAQNYAKGGNVQPSHVQDPYHVHGLPDAKSGGHVPYGLSPSHGHTVDDVVANLNAGEFVFPRDVTQHYGHKALYDMINKARKEMHGQVGEAQGKAPPKSTKQNFNQGGGI
jgi:hypothetical protein